MNGVRIVGAWRNQINPDQFTQHVMHACASADRMSMQWIDHIGAESPGPRGRHGDWYCREIILRHSRNQKIRLTER
jgi:hypothetical protein